MTAPDLLSLLRLVLVPVLLVLAWLQQPMIYFWLLLLALLTDAVDGWLARRLNLATLLGARLDSYADASLFLTTPICLILLFPDLMRRHAVLLGALLAVYLTSDLIGWLKFRQWPSYHTRAAKIGAVLLGVTLLVLFWLPNPDWLIYPSVGFFILALVEEIAITFTLPRWETNVPSWRAARERARRRPDQRAAQRQRRQN